MKGLKLNFLSHPSLARLNSLLRTAEGSRADLISPLCVTLLSTIGIFFIYSAQNYSGGKQWITQIVWVCVGLLLYLIISRVNYKIYLEYGHITYVLCIILLLLLWSPLGGRVYGSLRWLNFKIFSLQPSDPAKIGTLILAAGILARSEIGRFRDSLQTLTKVILVFGLPIVLIFLQPDLGSSLVFPPMLFALLYVSRLSKRFFASIFALFAILLGIVSLDIYGYHKFLQNNKLSKSDSTYESQAILPLKDYQRNRILAFVAPDVVDPKGIGMSWNLRQSLIAVGSGGLTGKGHNNSTQAKLGYLPQSVAPNDFIFSVLAEEKGFVGGLFVIVLYMLLVGNGIRIAGIARDKFGMLLALGICVIFMIHIFVNIGMTIGLMPITGIPLPFLSYGGSFTICCYIMQGLIQSIYRFRRDFV